MSQITKPYVIVFGNEKGGTGKSTLSMHVTVSLLYQNFSVTTIDLDGRQGTFSRYIDNRTRLSHTHQLHLPLPDHHPLVADEPSLDRIFSDCSTDFLVIDTPGSDTLLSQKAHRMTDLLVTPLNESFVDLDLLIRLDEIENNQLKPSVYAEMIWEQKMKRAGQNQGTFDWFVVSNRLQGVESRNKAKFGEILDVLSKRLGFTHVGGFRERTIFRELFVWGLTLLDKRPEARASSLSHIAARQELRYLVQRILMQAKKLGPEEEAVSQAS